jgi:hypothetical protein
MSAGSAQNETAKSSCRLDPISSLQFQGQGHRVWIMMARFFTPYSRVLRTVHNHPRGNAMSFFLASDPKLREYLKNLPTSFALSEEAVGRLCASGAQVLRDSAAFRMLAERLAQPR